MLDFMKLSAIWGKIETIVTREKKNELDKVNVYE